MHSHHPPRLLPPSPPLSYLVLPSVSTTIFGSFNCVSVDPEHLVPGLPKYLRLDYSISCDSPRWVFPPCPSLVSLPLCILAFLRCYLFINKPCTCINLISISRPFSRLNPYRFPCPYLCAFLLDLSL